MQAMKMAYTRELMKHEGRDGSECTKVETLPDIVHAGCPLWP